MMARSGSMRARNRAAHAAVGRIGAVAALAVAAAVSIALAACVPPQSGSRRGGRGDSAHTEITRVLNMRIHGSEEVSSPPILRLPVDGKPSNGLGSDALTVEFEMQSEQPPSISLLLVHCDRDWKPTENMFVQDPVKLRGNDFTIERAPIGVSHYDYLCRATFPTPDGRPGVTYGGNYLARIVDYYDNKKVLAESRFFAIEHRSAVTMDITSDFFESAQTKVLQHGLKVRVEVSPSGSLFGGEMLAVELFRSGQWLQPMIADDTTEASYATGQPWVTWSSSILGKTAALFANLPAGNEHRLLDLSDIVQYPTTSTVLTTPLSDIPRQNFLSFDNNGTTPDRLIPLGDADYVYFEFKLDLQGRSVREDIFVVGTFNDWLPQREWQMHFDPGTGFYTARGYIRRAFHEYQYVAGHWDDGAGVLRAAESTALEGNLTAANETFYALAYYHATTAGGFDKIVGGGIGFSGLTR